MNMKRTLLNRCLLGLSLAVLCTPNVAVSMDQSLLEPHLIVAAEAQLEDKDSHVIENEQAEIVNEVSNCVPAVRAALDRWVDQLKLIPTRTVVNDIQVRWVVDVDSPGPGFVVVNYRFFPTKRKALLEVLFDSGVTLSAQQKERVVTRFDLIRLKRTLVNKMKCTKLTLYQLLQESLCFDTCFRLLLLEFSLSYPLLPYRTAHLHKVVLPVP